MLRCLVLVITLVGCPNNSDDTDYAWTCPMRTSDELYVDGMDVGAGIGHPINNMIVGSTQLFTVFGAGNSVDASRFDAEFAGAVGMGITRVSPNQFAIHAVDDAGSGCLEVSLPGTDQVETFGLYAGHAYRVNVEPTTTPSHLHGENVAYLRGSRATIELWNGGGYQYVDSGMRITHGDQVQQVAWDTVQVLGTPGVVPLDVTMSDKETRTLSLEIIKAPDQLAVFSPDEMPSALVAGYSTWFCFDPTFEGRQVAGVTWSFAATNANWSAGMFYPGCVEVTPTIAGQTVTLRVDASGAKAELVFDVLDR